MKKLTALFVITALAAIGCVGPTGPKSYEADGPLAVEKSTRDEKADRTADAEPTRLAPASARVSAEDIDESNYGDYLRKLDSDIKQDRKALGKAGK
jgi:hypothetical protein